ncbi:MFS transporter [Novosphingobium sp. BL-52-GroH]|uniref:MFS transporter n=1 Tax=Novosphingobium sp. BL-52-GroH TaxID=3349877 RepID=UPI00384FAD06
MSDRSATRPPAPPVGPLGHRNFREIWFGSLLASLALMIAGVGAAWTMTLLTDSPQQVALVQSALMLPYLLFAMPAGAIADSYDRRQIGMIALGGAAFVNVLIVLVTVTDLMTPPLLLGLCFLLGIATSTYTPSWQSLVSEQVPGEVIPRAVTLNAISFNIARSFGPAVGGAIVALAGAAAAFCVSTFLYMPMLAAFWRWKRVPEKPRLPPERVGSAIVSGVRYIAHSAALRSVIVRSFLYCSCLASIVGLMPLISKYALNGGPLVFGILLGSYGGGAVVGGLFIDQFRARLGSAPVESGVTLTGIGVVVLAFCHNIWAASIVLILIGAVWTQALTSLNVAVQIGAPRWVGGRALAAFQATAAGGFAMGSWLGGYVAEQTSISVTLGASGLTLVLLSIAGRWLKAAEDIPDPTASLREFDDPQIDLALTGRSGPIVIEIEFRVPKEEARGFYEAMLEIRLLRRRNGVSAWTLARDIGDAERWVERFHCPTWHDYLRHRSRLTAAELVLVTEISDRYGIVGETRITRLLERPVGSVRWRDDTPDRGQVPTGIIP